MTGSDIGLQGSYVVVPARPGDARPLPTRRRDDVDGVLDELFGPEDPGGAGPADAVLLGGGAATAVVAALAGWPPIVTVIGVGAAVLGAILPIRSLWRRLAGRRARSRITAARSAGTLLRTDDPGTAELVAAHDAARREAARLDAAGRVEVEGIAHALLAEAATLLDGDVPTGPAAAAYVRDRTAALTDLAAAAAERATAAGRSSVVAARAEVDLAAGSSTLRDAADVAQRLRSR